MFNIFRFARDRRYIKDGRVGCPIRADGMNIERCFACRWLVEVDANRGTPFLRCRVESPVDPTQFVA